MACEGKRTKARRVLAGKTERLESLGAHARIILKWALKGMIGAADWMNVVQSRNVATICEEGYVKCGEFLD